MRLRFVSAPGGSAFMHELLTVVAREVEAVMDRTRIESVEVSEGPLCGDREDVFVVVPHEFFRVLPESLHPNADVAKRTIGFCVEHPGTDTFVTTLREARRLGACVDVNDDSTQRLAHSGVPVERFRLGYSAHWDVWGGSEKERPVDVLYLGTTDDRRSRFLSVDPETLSDYEVLMAMPPHEPMTRPRPDFFMGSEKLRLLSDSKVLLNLHRSESVSFEWVRALEAMSNGAVIVSEHSSDFAPLIPGRHFVSGSPHNLSHLARAMLTKPDRLRAMRDEAYELLRNELNMRASATMLAELACEVARRPRSVLPPRGSDTHTLRWPRWTAGTTNLPAAPSTRAVHAVDETRRPVDRVRAGCLPMRAAGSVDAIVFATPTTHFPSADSAEFVRSLQGLGETSARVINTDASGPPGALRNKALLQCDSEFVLLLDSGDEFLPGAIERLRAALDDPDMDAAYGFVITPRSTFLSAMPFEPARLETVDYLAPASMWRRSTLIEMGGWDERIDDPAETSRELWRRLATNDGQAALVQRPLVIARRA